MELTASVVDACETSEAAGVRPGRRPRIAVVLPSDFDERPTGGMLTAVKRLLAQVETSQFDIILFGLTWRPEEPVGRVSSRTINGQTYPFIPLYRVPVEDLDHRRPRLPLRARAFWACLLRGRRLLDRSFDLVHLHAPELLPLVVPKRHLVVYTIHGVEEAGALCSRYRFARTGIFLGLYRRVIAMLIERADRVLCIDEDSYRLYTTRWPARAKDFRLSPLTVEPEVFKPLRSARTPHLRASLGLQADMRVALYVGRLSRLKGVHLILDAFSAVARDHPDLQLAIVGNGEEEGALRAQVAERGVSERVLFAGKISHDELPRWYNAADVCVAASERESVGLTVLEALACGTPVVATRVGVAPLVIRDGINGALVEHRTSQALARGIEVALRLGRGAQEACIAAAREYGRSSVPLGEVILELLASRRTQTAARCFEKGQQQRANNQ